MKNINKFAKYVSAELGIDTPRIVFDLEPEKEGNLAAVEIVGTKKVVHVYNDIENVLDVYFAIAHELRHIYQVENNPELLNEKGELGEKDYNLHPAEIDANAYASVVCQECFGVKPLFIGLEEGIIEKIRSREREIWEP